MRINQKIQLRERAVMLKRLVKNLVKYQREEVGSCLNCAQLLVQGLISQVGKYCANQEIVFVRIKWLIKYRWVVVIRAFQLRFL